MEEKLNYEEEALEGEEAGQPIENHPTNALMEDALEGEEAGQPIEDHPTNALIEDALEGEKAGHPIEDHPMNALMEDALEGEETGQPIEDHPMNALMEDALEGEETGQPIEDHPMNALMEDALSFRRLKRGDTVEGTIVRVSPSEVLVDVNAKSEGVVPSRELERLGREGLESLQIGATLLVYVVKPEDRDGNLILSIRRAEEEGDWLEAQRLHEANESFGSQVSGFNKGGLIVRLGKLRGFVPASQLSAGHQGSNKQEPEERWARLVGDDIRVKVIEINRKRKRLILSERAAMRHWRDAQKAKLLEELRVGEVRTGKVSSLSSFGAFIDLGGADGLVHLSELSWNRAVKLRDVLKVGQQVEVYVLNVDPERKRIALSLKRLEPEPWTTVESRYYVGQLIEGTITRLANFGAFALVGDEIEGLIHISELSSGRVNHPQEVVREGEKHVMRIIRIDPRRRRMGLSLKRVADPSYADLDWRAELAEQEAAEELEGEAIPGGVEIADQVEVTDELEQVSEAKVADVPDDVEVVDEAAVQVEIEDVVEDVVAVTDETAGEAEQVVEADVADDIEIVDEAVAQLETEDVIEAVDEAADETAVEAAEETAVEAEQVAEAEVADVADDAEIVDESAAEVEAVAEVEIEDVVEATDEAVVEAAAVAQVEVEDAVEATVEAADETAVEAEQVAEAEVADVANDAEIVDEAVAEAEAVAQVEVEGAVEATVEAADETAVEAAEETAVEAEQVDEAEVADAPDDVEIVDEAAAEAEAAVQAEIEDVAEVSDEVEETAEVDAIADVIEVEEVESSNSDEEA
ncbi:S1 RNA-binding domain-containing protein [Chloroflexota bacterium]